LDKLLLLKLQFDLYVDRHILEYIRYVRSLPAKHLCDEYILRDQFLN
jgi:hypothetical protein